MPQKEQLLEFVRTQWEIRPDCPWEDLPDALVLRHPDNEKWFGLIMPVSRKKLDLEGAGTTEVLNLKAEPDTVDFLKTEAGFHPAYHMNKTHWLTVRLDDSVATEQITALLEASYDLTRSKRKGR